MNDIYIYGASGHGKIILDIFSVLKINVTSFIDDNIKLTSFQDHEVLHNIPKDAAYIVGIGDNRIRKRITENNSAEIIDALIHPKATVAINAIIGSGTVVAAGAVINSSAVIKSNCIINTSSVVEHDCIIEDFVHVSPNSTLCGNVTIGKGTHVGAASVVIPSVKIGSWCTIGAGSVVINDIPDGATAVGNPARIIKGK